MRFRLIPREQSFFPLFCQAAENMLDAARKLKAEMDDLDGLEVKHKAVVETELRGDSLTREILRKLNSTYVTPFDREDIHALTEQIDDVVDEIQGVSDLLVLHRISEPLPEMKEIADIIVQAAAATVTLVAKLQNPRQVQGELEEVDRLESAADAVYRRTVANLFAGGYEAREVLRWKDIVEAMEAAMNGIEDVSNIIEAIVLKHA